MTVWDTLGYPLFPAPPYGFDGNKMWMCRGGYTRMLTLNEIGKASNLTCGSSGAPWLIPDTEIVNGVQSCKDVDYQGENFSPYFDDAVLALYNQAFSLPV